MMKLLRLKKIELGPMIVIGFLFGMLIIFVFIFIHALNSGAKPEFKELEELESGFDDNKIDSDILEEMTGVSVGV